MKIAFTSVTFRKKSVEKIVEIARKNDIVNIEWGGDIHLKYDDIASANKIKKLTDGAINNMTYGSYYRLGESDFAKSEQQAKFEKICQVASIIGAKIVRVWLGNKSSASVSDNEVEVMADEMRALCDIAAKFGLTVASEFHNNTFNDCGQTAISFVQKVGKQNLKTMWQPLGDDETDFLNLKLVMPYLCEVHIFNWERGRRKLLSKGARLWQKFLQPLIEEKSEINFVLEFVKNDSVRIFKKDVATLKQLLQK